jgi:anti-sigma regulatory factor (Ser/Thr protein kinase)
MAPAADHHNLCLYAEDDELIGRVTPYLSEGLREREAVVVVVDPRKRALLAAALGEPARRIDWIDRDSYYTRPEAALAGYDAQVRRYLRGGIDRIRVFGELPLCHTPEETDLWILYEALLNPAFAHHPVTILCGLDAREQPDGVVTGAWETHPTTLNRHWSDNAHFHDPREVVRERTPAAADAPGLKLLSGSDSRTLRGGLFAELWAEGMPEESVQDMVLAAGEVLANAYRYGGGVRGVRVGRVGERFVCEIADHGPGVDEPLAGYLPPVPGRGAGLWVARQLTRRLEMISTERGLTTRLWV